jgi:hypothetical protein
MATFIPSKFSSFTNSFRDGMTDIMERTQARNEKNAYWDAQEAIMKSHRAPRNVANETYGRHAGNDQRYRVQATYDLAANALQAVADQNRSRGTLNPEMDRTVANLRRAANIATKDTPSAEETLFLNTTAQDALNQAVKLAPGEHIQAVEIQKKHPNDIDLNDLSFYYRAGYLPKSEDPSQNIYKQMADQEKAERAAATRKQSESDEKKKTDIAFEQGILDKYKKEKQRGYGRLSETSVPYEELRNAYEAAIRAGDTSSAKMLKEYAKAIYVENGDQTEISQNGTTRTIHVPSEVEKW